MQRGGGYSNGGTAYVAEMCATTSARRPSGYTSTRPTTNRAPSFRIHPSAMSGSLALGRRRKSMVACAARRMGQGLSRKRGERNTTCAAGDGAKAHADDARTAETKRLSKGCATLQDFTDVVTDRSAAPGPRVVSTRAHTARSASAKSTGPLTW